MQEVKRREQQPQHVSEQQNNTFHLRPKKQKLSAQSNSLPLVHLFVTQSLCPYVPAPPINC